MVEGLVDGVVEAGHQGGVVRRLGLVRALLGQVFDRMGQPIGGGLEGLAESTEGVGLSGGVVSGGGTHPGDATRSTGVALASSGLPPKAGQ